VRPLASPLGDEQDARAERRSLRLSHKNARFLVGSDPPLRSSQHTPSLLYHLPFLPNTHPFFTRPLPPVVSEHASLALLHLSVLCSPAHPLPYSHTHPLPSPLTRSSFVGAQHTHIPCFPTHTSLAFLPHTSFLYILVSALPPFQLFLPWRPNTHIPCFPTHTSLALLPSPTHIPCLHSPLTRSSSLCFRTHTFLPFYTLQCFVSSPTHIPCLLLSRALPPWEPHAHPSPSTPLSGPFRGRVQMCRWYATAPA
jgi:hypothetical protein